MPSRRLPPWLIEEYLTVLFGSEEMDHDERQREAIEHHAELNFRLNGGGRCGICRSHVRHVVQVTVHKGGDTQVYRCLCTRCLEGERSTANMVSLSLGRAVISYQPRVMELTPRPWNESRTERDAAPARRLAAAKR